MWEERAHRARREVAALGAAGLGVRELHSRAIGVLEREVPAELTCWAALDPETLVIVGMVSGEARIPARYEPLLAAAEYSGAEPHTFAGLARGRRTAARLSDMSRPERDRSARVRTVWRPLGLDQEVRVPFRVDGVTWGAAGMVRSGGDFTDREVDLLTAVAPAIAAATRVGVRVDALAASPGGRPAVVVVDVAHGRVRASTPGAQEWRDRLDEVAPGRFDLVMQMMAAGARSATSGGFRARVHDARGGWAVLDAGRLVGGDDDEVAVAIEPAGGDQLMSLLLAAYGLTARERDVLHEVVSGRSTAEIAGRLFISANTVQDHLKSVFAKVGVRSRGELVARLRPEASAPSADASGAQPRKFSALA